MSAILVLAAAVVGFVIGAVIGHGVGFSDGQDSAYQEIIKRRMQRMAAEAGNGEGKEGSHVA